MRLYKSVFIALLTFFSAFPVQSAVDFQKIFTDAQGQIRQYFEEKMPDELRVKLMQGFVQEKNWRPVAYLVYPLARKGDMNAQVNLGLMYINGWGVPQDYNKAYWWLSEAAEKGSIKAINNLAGLYLDGNGTKKDIPHAIKLFEKTADSNSTNAMLLLGRIYYEKVKDYSKALHWFSKGSEKGDLESKYRLALMYEKGEGTPVDPQKANALYEQVAAQNGQFSNDAKQKLARFSAR